MTKTNWPEMVEQKRDEVKTLEEKKGYFREWCNADISPSGEKSLHLILLTTAHSTAVLALAEAERMVDRADVSCGGICDDCGSFLLPCSCSEGLVDPLDAEIADRCGGNKDARRG